MLRRRVGLSIGLAAAYLAIGSCGREITGPERATGGLVFAPTFANAMASAIVDFAFVRIVLTPPGGTTPVLDTVVPFPAAEDSLTLTFSVPVSGSTTPYVLRVAMTDTQGDTVFRIGPVTVTASTNPNAEAEELPEPDYVGVGANAAGVRFVSLPATAGFDEQVVIVAEAFDDEGVAIPDTPIGFELVNLGDSTRATFADPGVGTLETKQVRGPVAIRAVLLTGQTVQDIIEVIPAATGIEVVSGDGQSAVVGTAVAAPLLARVVADDDLGVPDIAVRFHLVHGVDTLFVVEDTSAANGDVSYTPTLGEISGAYQVTVEAVDVSIGTATFTATANAGAPFALEFTSQPTGVVAAEAMTPAVQVTARDGFGNVATSFVGSVTVSLLSDTGTALLVGTVSRAAVAGVATFDDISVNLAGTEFVMLAESGALEPDTSEAFNVNVGAAALAAFSVQPPLTTLPSTPFTVEVEVRDAGGNIVPGFAGLVTLGLSGNPASGTLTGTTVVAASAGVALFDDLEIDNFGDGYSLSATVSGVTGATSNTLDVTLPGGVNAWANLAGGNWSNAVNWSLGTVPTAADTVWIKQSGTYTVVLDAAMTMARVEIGAPLGAQTLSLSSPTITLGDTLFVGDNASLNLTGGAFNGTGAIVADGAFFWTGGNLTGGGSVRVNAGGTLAIAGTNARTLNNFRLELAGTGTWSGTHAIGSGSAAVFRVLPGGTLDIQGKVGLFFDQGGAQTIFDVQGAALRTSLADTAWVPGLTVSGTLDVLTGVFEARNAGTSTGNITVGPSGRMRFGSGTHTLTAAATVDGDGIVEVATSATVHSAGVWSLAGTLRVPAGVFNYNAASGSVAAFDLVGGTKGGSGVLEVTSAMNWSSGSLSGANGTTRVLPGATLIIAGTAARSLNAQQLELGGTGIWTDTHAIGSGSGGVIRVLPTGTLDIQGKVGLFFDQGGAQSNFEAQGAVTRTVSADTAWVPGLAVSGTLDIVTGVFEARNTGTSSGNITVGPSGTMRFGAGTHTLDGTATIDGDGLVEVVTSATVHSAGVWSLTGTLRAAGGVLNYNAASGSVAAFDLVGGTKSGSGVLEVTDSMTWTTGSLSGSTGTTRVVTGASLLINGTAARSLGGQQLELGGTGVWTGTHSIGSGSGGTFRVLPSGSLDIQGRVGLFFDQGGAQSSFLAQGAVTRTVSTDTVWLAGLGVSGTLLISTGVVETRNTGSSSGVITVGPSGTFRIGSGTQTITSSGRIEGAGAVVVVTSGTLVNAGDWALTGVLRVTAGTFNHNGAGGTIDSLVLTGGTIGGTGLLTVTGHLDWVGGDFSGSNGTTRVDVAATMTIGGAAGRSLNAYQVEIAGAGIWTGTQSISSGSAGTIRVLPTGTLDIQDGPSWIYNQGGTQSLFDVQGALTKSVSSATAIVPGLSVSGTVLVLTGALEPRSTGTSTGTMTVAPGAILRFTAGTQTLAAGSLVEGDGLVDVSTSATVNADGGWAVTGITRVSSGVFHFNGAGTTADFELFGGTKAGSGTFEIANLMTWTGGHLSGGNGITRVLTGGALLIDGATARTFNAHQLEVAGTGVWAGSAIFSSGSGAVLRVLPSGAFDMQGNARWNYDQGGAQSMFEVQGAATRTISSDTTVVPGLSVSGTLLVASGVLEARNTGTSSGALTVAVGGELRFTNGSQTLTAPSMVDGAGRVVVGTGGTVNSAGGWAVAGTTRLTAGTLSLGSPTASTSKFELAGGTRAGAGTLTVTDSMRWTAGNLSAGGGTTLIDPAAVLEITGAGNRTLNAQTLEIAGAALWSASHTMNSGTGGTLRVAAGGTLDIQGDPIFTYDQGGAQSVFHNLGSVVRSAGTGSMIVSATMQQAGALAVNTGTFAVQGSGSLDGNVTIASGANLLYDAGTYAMQPGYQTTGLGDATLDGATLNGLTTGDTARFDRLTLVTGNLSPAAGGVVRIDNSAIWSGSAGLSGGGTTHIASGAVLQLQGAATRSLNNHTLAVEGTALWTSAFTLSSGTSGRLRVMPTGLLSVQHPAATTASFNYDQGGTVSVFEVQGDVAMISTGNFNVSAQLQHSGTTVLTEGVTTFSNGGTLGGDVAVAAAASLNLAGGTLTLANLGAVTGEGLTTLTGGTLSVAGVSDTAEIGRLRLDAGVVDPNGVIVVTDHLEWAGSTSITGGTLVAADTLIISGAATRSMTAATLETQGITRWTGNMNLQTGSLGRLRNMPGATFQWESPANFLYNLGGTAPTFENRGTMVFSAAGTAQITSPFVDTTGTGITVQSGTVTLGGGGRIGGGSIVHTEGPLQLTSGTFSLKNGARFTAGAGSLQVMTGASITADSIGADSVSIQRLELAGGSLNHEGLIAIETEMLWGTGTITSNGAGLGGITRIGVGGALDINGAGTKSFTGPHTLDVVSGATAAMTSTSVLNTGSGSVIRNGGYFSLVETGPINYALGGTAPRFQNLGSGVLESVGVNAGGIGMPMENAGGTLIASGSPLILSAGSVNAFHGLVSSVGAPLSLTGGTFALSGGLNITGVAGDLTLTAAALTLGANTLTMNGDLNVGAAATINSSNAASLLDVNGNVTFAGAASTMSAGELRVGGNFTQGPGGVTNSFNATGTHRTFFKGSGGQEISFNAPGNSRFNILAFGSTANAGSLELLTAVTATQLSDTNSAQQDTIASANGSQLTVTGVAAMDSIAFVGARLALTNGTGSHSIAGIRFDAMDPTSTYLTVQMNAGVVVTVDRPYFATAPTSGYYVEARQMAIGAAARVHLTAPIFPGNPLLRYLLTPASSSFPEVMWDTQLNPPLP